MKVISVSPCKPNIVYSIVKCDNLLEAFARLLHCIQVNRVNAPRTLIFCQTMNDCSTLYLFFKNAMGKHFVQPTDAPDQSKFRLIDMFHRHTDPEVRSNIIKLFTCESQLRIVICMVSFGMGINCPDVRRVFHASPPDDTESYIQETGCCGRDGLAYHATIILKKRIPRTLDYSMQEYIFNVSRCRRDVLFGRFESYVEVVWTTNVCVVMYAAVVAIA